MKTKDIYLKYREYLYATSGIINRYENVNRCMTIAALDNEMNEALNKIVIAYANVMVADAPVNFNDMPFDIVDTRSCSAAKKSAATFIYKFSGFFERQADTFNYNDLGESTADVAQSCYLADIQFNVNRAQRVIDRMVGLIKGSQYIHQQEMAA